MWEEAPTPRSAWAKETWPGTFQWPPHSVLGRLPASSRAEILKSGHFREYSREETFIREDDRTDFVVLLLQGWVKITAATENGGTALLAIRHGGDLVGELAGLDSEPRSATATAAGSVVAKMIRAEEFLSLLRRAPDVHQVVSSTIGAKLRSATRRHVEFGGCSVAMRVARVVFELQRAYGSDAGQGARSVGIPLTQPELAGLVGAAEPTVHKALRELRQRGILDTGYRSLLIRDLVQLQRAANLPAGSS
ncbi:Crp/Fnr family transcriptional regulator [Frankia tisae]|uniref:Crp/Fnr family transcriptional regulator n=1 Tax=Frankia tisae TaxID=2950104 RepID=UPI0021BE562C|nr:Crp/Fnr family transcriptional regulator [Frankia tisae]